MDHSLSVSAGTGRLIGCGCSEVNRRSGACHPGGSQASAGISNPRRFAAGHDDLACREGGAKRPGPDDCVDPPYGIRFGSNWEVSTSRRDVKDGRAEDVIRQPEQVRAFRDTWQPGVDYCMAYLRDRLVTARDVLTETGSSFLQIGDEHVHLVQRVLDEVAHGEPAVPDGNAVAADVVDEVPGTPVGDAAALPTRQSRLVAAESGTAGGLVEGLVGPRGGTGIGEGAGGE